MRCGQLMTYNMNYIHVKFQDRQQKWAGVRVEVKNNGDGEDLGD